MSEALPRAAVALARLRWHGTLPAAGLPLKEMEQAAAEAGRAVVTTREPDDAGGIRTMLTLGWADEEPEAATQRPRLPRRRLPASAVRAFLASYALLADPQAPDAVEVATVVALLEACSNKQVHTWATPALQRHLPEAGLVRVCGETVRLGAGVAALDTPTRQTLDNCAARLRTHPGYPHAGAARRAGAAAGGGGTAQTAPHMPWEPGEGVHYVRALEAASSPLPVRDWALLQDPMLRRDVERRLAGIGRQLVEVTEPDRDGWPEVRGYLPGWHPDLGQALGVGLAGVTRQDLAVLTLLWIHGDWIPEVDETARSSQPLERLVREHKGPDGRGLLDGQIDESLARLKTGGLIDTSCRVQQHTVSRLDADQHRWLRQNMTLLCQPDGSVAAEIRRRRGETEGDPL